ncbi:hypothetical protein HN903_00510 [archaeon]|jgi:hypothetical protein|nr:hypothetical protein [archaeon]MBT7128215.1 hypothetical protein [archaeon]
MNNDIRHDANGGFTVMYDAEVEKGIKNGACYLACNTSEAGRGLVCMDDFSRVCSLNVKYVGDQE